MNMNGKTDQAADAIHKPRIGWLHSGAQPEAILVITGEYNVATFPAALCAEIGRCLRRIRMAAFGMFTFLAPGST
jgi:hypothetical protein